MYPLRYDSVKCINSNLFSSVIILKLIQKRPYKKIMYLHMGMLIQLLILYKKYNLKKLYTFYEKNNFLILFYIHDFFKLSLNGYNIILRTRILFLELLLFEFYQIYCSSNINIGIKFRLILNNSRTISWKCLLLLTSTLNFQNLYLLNFGLMTKIQK